MTVKLSGNRPKFLPMNVPLKLRDGRLLLVIRGEGHTMIVRQKAPPPALKIGEEIVTVPSRDGKAVVLKVEKLKGKNIHLRILGLIDVATSKPVGTEAPKPPEGEARG